jgi:hypothetical protein
VAVDDVDFALVSFYCVDVGSVASILDNNMKVPRQ